MFDRLVACKRPVEYLSVHCVIAGHVNASLRAAHALERNLDGNTVEQGIDRSAGPVAEQLRFCPVKRDFILPSQLIEAFTANAVY